MIGRKIFSLITAAALACGGAGSLSVSADSAAGGRTPYTYEFYRNGSLYKTQSIVYLFYTYAFTNSNRGYGAAIVMVLVVFIMIVTFILQKLEKKLVYYN